MSEPVIDKEHEWYEQEIRRLRAIGKSGESANMELIKKNYRLQKAIEGHEAAIREAIQLINRGAPYLAKTVLYARLKVKP